MSRSSIAVRLPGIEVRRRSSRPRRSRGGSDPICPTRSARINRTTQSKGGFQASAISQPWARRRISLVSSFLGCESPAFSNDHFPSPIGCEGTRSLPAAFLAQFLSGSKGLISIELCGEGPARRDGSHRTRATAEELECPTRDLRLGQLSKDGRLFQL
jgi:hypothetical protein